MKTRGGIEKADLKVARKIGQWRDHPAVRTVGIVGELADQPQLYALSAATVVIGLFRADSRMVRAGVRMLAAEWLATKAKNFVKHRVDRTRPHVPVEGGRYRIERGGSRDSAMSSFPSGHTAGAVAVARAYSSEYPEHAATATLLATLAGGIQIPRCSHFVSDVGAGAVIGLAAGSLVAKRSQPRRMA
ncbi:phosphatase PAP2 family protein [Sphingomonas naphthae]|uniref:Phosphatase PAP2 family protein n=1 Tax=Sphingomonas naphthae TaxID=1813468 RepID=A0ABY7THH4_9SPHN|nr:phosphatase PAP2 family protein [Sphingomonas naphthae]WCT72677.1 phosphatase PAP2 family protein [Sphingomonas naphthae]